jgi:ATP-dependent DNA ligase
VQLCAFDVLAIDGEDLRNLPLSMRKTNLERLLRGRPMASSSTLSRSAPLVPISSKPPATWD